MQKINVGQVGIFEIGSVQACHMQTRATQPSFLEIRITKVSMTELRKLRLAR
jgi:hypothetical protein